MGIRAAAASLGPRGDEMSCYTEARAPCTVSGFGELVACCVGRPCRLNRHAKDNAPPQKTGFSPGLPGISICAWRIQYRNESRAGLGSGTNFSESQKTTVGIGVLISGLTQEKKAMKSPIKKRQESAFFWAKNNISLWNPGKVGAFSKTLMAAGANCKWTAGEWPSVSPPLQTHGDSVGDTVLWTATVPSEGYSGRKRTWFGGRREHTPGE